MGSFKRRQGLTVRVGTGTSIKHKQRKQPTRSISPEELKAMPADAVSRLMRIFQGPKKRTQSTRQK